MKLTALKKGERGVIVSFDEIDKRFCNRLYDIGITVGSEIILLDILGFGTLFYLLVDDLHFCIRLANAEKIVIEKIR